MHILTSIRAVYTLLVSWLQVISCVQTTLSGIANTFRAVTVYKVLQVPGQINSLYVPTVNPSTLNTSRFVAFFRVLVLRLQLLQCLVLHNVCSCYTLDLWGQFCCV